MNRTHRLAATTLAVLACTGLGSVAFAADTVDLADRVNKAREVYQALVSTPDRGVPQELQERCQCVAVFPQVVKVAVGIGGRYGSGVVSCRNGQEWSPIGFFKMSGGSWGLQLGAQSTEVVLFIMTEKGARSLLQSKFTLGGTASVAAGPLGRSAEASTDLNLNAEIYSYARAKGLFAGISLEGARLAANQKDITQYYGKPVTAKELLFDHKAPKRPAEMEEFLRALPAGSSRASGN
jgi:SH3 domain-containing YSC84-like protein 1